MKKVGIFWFACLIIGFVLGMRFYGAHMHHNNSYLPLFIGLGVAIFSVISLWVMFDEDRK